MLTLVTYFLLDDVLRELCHVHGRISICVSPLWCLRNNSTGILMKFCANNFHLRTVLFYLNSCQIPWLLTYMAGVPCYFCLLIQKSVTVLVFPIFINCLRKITWFKLISVVNNLKLLQPNEKTNRHTSKCNINLPPKQE